ncbi:MAG TPA: DUF4412 domain-containing protein [Myxococcota bacterium]|nr:DUF4412 domain-containing protein [Myxococcota bacterium]
MPRRTALAALLLLLAASPLLADSLLTVRSSIEGLKMDQPNQNQVQIWVNGDRLRRDEGDTTYILRLDRNKLYVINHVDRTYNELGLPIDPQKWGGPAGVQMKVQVTATGESRKVWSWNARKFRVDINSPEGLQMETAIWASKDIASYQAYNRLAASIAALQPGSSDWARQLEQVEGFPVLQEADVTMGGTRFKTREELVSVENRTPPAGAYEVPGGYTKEAR